jgi:hypothetical protein
MDEASTFAKCFLIVIRKLFQSNHFKYAKYFRWNYRTNKMFRSLFNLNMIYSFSVYFQIISFLTQSMTFLSILTDMYSLFFSKFFDFSIQYIFDVPNLFDRAQIGRMKVSLFVFL